MIVTKLRLDLSDIGGGGGGKGGVVYPLVHLLCWWPLMGGGQNWSSRRWDTSLEVLQHPPRRVSFVAVTRSPCPFTPFPDSFPARTILVSPQTHSA